MFGMNPAHQKITLQHLKILAREFDCFVHTNGPDVILSRQDGTEFLDYVTLHCFSATEAREACADIISAFA